MINITYTNNKIITITEQIKMLGFTLNSRGSFDMQVTKNKHRMGLEFSKLKLSINLMTRKDKMIIFTSKINFFIFQGLPLYLGENENILQKVESTIMMVNRQIHGWNNFHLNKECICKEICVDIPRQEILKTGLKFPHKAILHKKYESILEQLIIPTRAASKIYMKNLQKGNYNSSLDIIIVDYYNKLPPTVKTMTIRQFNRYLAKHTV